MKKVEASIEVEVSSQQAMDAFLSPEHLKAWWGVERSFIELKVGGIYALAWQISDAGIKYISTGVIKEYQPPSRLVIEKWVYFNPEKPIMGPLELSFNIEPAGTHSKISVCQAGYREGEHWQWYYDAVVLAWPMVLKELKKYLEGKKQ
jgi:uncharacterized protein YndB with AHSA1/START domain